MQALAGCLGWRLEGAGSTSQSTQLSLRYGSLFQLRLPLPMEVQDSDSTQASLQLAPTGTLPQLGKLSLTVSNV